MLSIPLQPWQVLFHGIEEKNALVSSSHKEVCFGSHIGKALGGEDNKSSWFIAAAGENTLFIVWIF